MEKEQNLDQRNKTPEPSAENSENKNQLNENQKNEAVEEIKELSPEEKIKELEDKLARTFAEMENQRRRF